MAKCDSCFGQGYRDCYACDGSGTEVLGGREIDCQVCGGSGSLMCWDCDGSGKA